MRVVQGESAAAVVKTLTERGRVNLSSVESAVGRIVSDVRRDGDAALRRYAGKFDGLAPGQSLQVPERDIRTAWDAVTPVFRTALKEAAANIRRYCKWQKPKEWMRDMAPGLRVGQLVRPLDSVG